MGKRTVVRWRHRPKVWDVYVYSEARPAAGDFIYRGRYRIIALIIAAAVWPFTTDTVEVVRRG